MPITMPGPRPADDENPDDKGKPKNDTPLDDQGIRPASRREQDLVRRLLDWDNDNDKE